jgi:hypothetical protein
MILRRWRRVSGRECEGKGRKPQQLDQTKKEHPDGL